MEKVHNGSGWFQAQTFPMAITNIIKSTSTIILTSRVKSQCHKLYVLWTPQLTMSESLTATTVLNTLETKMSLGHREIATVHFSSHISIPSHNLHELFAQVHVTFQFTFGLFGVRQICYSFGNRINSFIIWFVCCEPNMN